MFSKIRRHIAVLIGRHLFRRAIRGEIPDYVSNVVAVEYPIPCIRSRKWPLVAFSYCEPFERDVLITGWEDFTNQKNVVAIVACIASGAEVKPSRIYTRLGERTRVWLILDESSKKGCFYLTGL